MKAIHLNICSPCPRRIVAALGAAFLFAWTTAGQTWANETYRLHPLDQVRIRALEWNPPTSTFQVWEGMSGDYSLDSLGRLSLPLIGIIDVDGKSLDEASELISRELQLQTGSPDRIRVGFDVIGHRPVYVLGAVKAPGSVRFEPGLTGQQALALAGGIRRLLDDDDSIGLADLFGAEGNARLLDQQLTAKRELRARILSEIEMLDSLDGAEVSTASSGQLASTSTDASAQSELDRLIVEASRQAKAEELDSLSSLEAFLSDQISGLEAQRSLLSEQIARVEADLEGVETLREQGLAVNSRTTALANSLASLKSDGIQLDIALLNAQQQLNRIRREAAGVVSSSRSDLLQRLSELDDEIAGLDIRLSSAQLVFLELSSSDVSGRMAEAQPAEPTITFTRTRIVDGEPVQESILPTDELAPGDTVEVTLELSTIGQVPNR